MSWMRVDCGGQSRLLPMAPETTVGRSELCTWPLTDERVASQWIELRWFGRPGWGWRSLAAGGRTRGPRRPVPGHDGWGALRPGDRIRAPGAQVTIEDTSAPVALVTAVDGSGRFHIDDLSPVLEQHGAHWWARGFEDHEGAEPVRPGQIFLAGGSPWRLHLADSPTSTSRPHLDLLSPGCCLDLELVDEPRLLAHDGEREASLSGSVCWVLLPYFEARLDDLPVGGWLTLDDVWARLLEVQPGTGSRRDKVTEDRSRLTRGLIEAGVDNATTLFEVRRSGGRGVRVSFDAARLALVGP